MNKWIDELEEGKQVDVVFFDFSKAFDKIQHGLLLEKLRQIGLDETLIAWIESFLTNRSFRVKINSSLSSSRLAPCGVPQGSVLSPILFCIFSNEISELIPKAVSCSQYADDLKIFSAFSKKDPKNDIQSAINAISDWADKVHLQLNMEKTVCISLGSRPRLFDYSLKGTLIKREAIIRDLGFYLNKNLDFDEHWRIQIKKANLASYTIFKKFYSNDTKLMTLLFKTFIRPFLEYGTPITNTHKRKTIRAIESVQSTFTRKLMFRQAGYVVKRDDPSYRNAEQRSNIFGLESLESRRKQLDNNFLQKWISGKIDIDHTDFFQIRPHTINTRHRHRFRWKTPKSKLKENFFTHRVLSKMGPFAPTQ